MGKKAIILCGGGFLGAAYEIGTLKALNQQMQNFSINKFDIYQGLSAGAFVASLLANQLPIDEIYASLFNDTKNVKMFNGMKLQKFNLDLLLKLAKISLFPAKKFIDWTLDMKNPISFEFAYNLIFDMGEKILSEGIHSGRGLELYLKDLFSKDSRTDDFSKLEKELYICATDTDNGELTEPIVFGNKNYNNVPISLAVKASCSLPGYFEPTIIPGKYFSDNCLKCFTDGALNNTTYIQNVINNGAEFIICINPLRPIKTSPGKILSEGKILQQSLRAANHSRLHHSLINYKIKYPHIDILLFEPSKNDWGLFENPQKSEKMGEIAERSYKFTLKQIFLNHTEMKESYIKHYGHNGLEELFKKHGIQLMRPSHEEILSKNYNNI